MASTHREAWTKSYCKLKNNTSIIIVVQALRMISWSPIQSRTKLTEVTWKLNFSKLRRPTLQWVLCMPGFNRRNFLRDGITIMVGLNENPIGSRVSHDNQCLSKTTWLAVHTNVIFDPICLLPFTDFRPRRQSNDNQMTIFLDNLSRQSHLGRIMHKMLS